LPLVLNSTTFIIISGPSFGTATFNAMTDIITYNSFSPTFTGRDELVYGACVDPAGTQCGTGTICFLLVPNPVPVVVVGCDPGRLMAVQGVCH
jgi:hypothetical protein